MGAQSSSNGSYDVCTCSFQGALLAALGPIGTLDPLPVVTLNFTNLTAPSLLLLASAWFDARPSLPQLLVPDTPWQSLLGSLKCSVLSS